jgi:hypothetical protein
LAAFLPEAIPAAMEKPLRRFFYLAAPQSMEFPGGKFLERKRRFHRVGNGAVIRTTQLRYKIGNF